MRSTAIAAVGLFVIGCSQPPAQPSARSADDDHEPAPQMGPARAVEEGASGGDVASATLASAASWNVLAAVTAGQRSFAIVSSGSCDPRALARNAPMLGEDARIVPVDAETPRREYTLFSDQGACVVSSGDQHMLAFPRSDTHRETRNCPIAVELLGCAGAPANAYLLLAIEGRRTVEWTRAVTARDRSFGWRDGSGVRSFETLGVTNPWPSDATRIGVSEIDFQNGARVLTTTAQLADGGYGSLMIVLERNQLRWRERAPGDLDAHVKIDGIGFLLLTEDWGGWRLRAVHTGEGWSGDWPIAFHEDYGN